MQMNRDRVLAWLFQKCSTKTGIMGQLTVGIKLSMGHKMIGREVIGKEGLWKRSWCLRGERKESLQCDATRWLMGRKWMTRKVVPLRIKRNKMTETQHIPLRIWEETPQIKRPSPLSTLGEELPDSNRSKEARSSGNKFHTLLCHGLPVRHWPNHSGPSPQRDLGT